jgi:hypothetical protein
MGCKDSFRTGDLRVGVECESECEGCAFSADVVSDSNDDGCTFAWTVYRTGCANNAGSQWSGSDTLTCPDTKSYEFECDAAGACKAYRLTLVCEVEGAGGSGVG